ncbi:unnamed protein product [Musa acuminata var. zebrina]
MVSQRAEVDTTSPFRSVKEAVEIFGERFLTGNVNSHKTSSSAKLDIIRSPPIYSLPPPKPLLSANSSPPSLSSTARFIHERDDELVSLDALKKLEHELHETKCELKLLKERQSETKLAVASLCLQLQKSMSKLREIEAVEAEPSNLAIEDQPCKVRSDRWREDNIRESEYLPTLAQALSLGRMEHDLCGKGRRKLQKRKPIVPLIGDIFAKKKEATDCRNSLYTPSFYSVLS